MLVLIIGVLAVSVAMEIMDSSHNMSKGQASKYLSSLWKTRQIERTLDKWQYSNRQWGSFSHARQKQNWILLSSCYVERNSGKWYSAQRIKSCKCQFLHQKDVMLQQQQRFCVITLSFYCCVRGCHICIVGSKSSDYVDMFVCIRLTRMDVISAHLNQGHFHNVFAHLLHSTWFWFSHLFVFLIN